MPNDFEREDDDELLDAINEATNENAMEENDTQDEGLEDIDTTNMPSGEVEAQDENKNSKDRKRKNKK